MIADLNPYPAMKNSGVPWLGEVPEHWEVRKLRHVLEGVTERNRSDLPLLSVVREKGVIRRDTTSKDENPNFIPDDLSNYKVVRAGQFAMNKMKAWQGSYGVSHHDGIVSPAYFVFDVSGIEGEYFHAAIRSKTYVPFFTQASDGVRIGQWDLSQARMKEIPFFVPPLHEQSAIVRFLDHADRRIKRYIIAKQKLIKLLEEQRQAIIHRAVTRGLDPNVRLKPSGVEWLRDIPQHWRIVRNMALFAHRVEPGVAGLFVFQVSLRSGITAEELDQFGRPKKLIADPTKYKRIYKNDIAYNTMRMWQGAVGVSPSDGLVSPAYVVLSPRSGTISDFYDLVFHTDIYKRQVNRQSTGIVSDRNRLYWDSFKQMPNLVLPKSEQEAIVNFVRSETNNLNRARVRLEAEISLLREYRTRLIADVVTGKLDVRTAAAKLPDETGEPESLDDADSLIEEDDNSEEVDLDALSEEAEA